ncbi:MAG: Rieske 2Fe-2S domain-containing protein [Pseudomonadota bacterium]
MGWIAGGLCADVPPGTVIPVCIGGVDLAVWCSQTGVYSAWADRCPHRGMRLSHGFVRGETLSCIYHGWQYDQSGSCIYIPAHPQLTPPRTICATSYPCASRDGAIWISLAASDESPPETGGREPVRSLPFAGSAERVARFVDADLDALAVLGGEADLAVAIQPVSDTACMVHAFAANGYDPKSVSVQLESMRGEFEELAA